MVAISNGSSYGAVENLARFSDSDDDDDHHNEPDFVLE